MHDSAISGDSATANTEALNAVPAENQHTEQKKSVFSKVAGNLAKALNLAMKFAMDNKIAVAGLAITSIALGPWAGIAVFAAILGIKHGIETVLQKQQSNATAAEKPNTQKQVAT
ncbi:MAG: hypothetical protein AB1516_00065 [Pseudomonadota bacterium]